MKRGLVVSTLALLSLGATPPPPAPPGPDVACPPSFKQATGACDPRGPTSCTYAEGRCECLRSVPCSGAAQPLGEPRWLCVPKRTDGCPDGTPSPGSPCTKPGKKCSYGTCGSIELSCDAKTHKWFISGGVAPPPSRPDAGPPPHPTPVPPTGPHPLKK
jgi:hypothetical protein